MVAESVQFGQASTARTLDRIDAGQVCSPIDAIAGRWWVLHTKARNEKALALELERRAISCFLPLARVRRKYGRRLTDVSLPLFPGYLFMCGTQEQRYAALTTNRIANVLEVDDQDRLRASLRQIHRAVSSDIAVSVYPGLVPGRRCRVVAGSLKDLDGTVVRSRGKCRVYIAVEILGQSAEVELDPGLLEIGE